MKMMLVDPEADGEQPYGIQWKTFGITEIIHFIDGRDALSCLKNETFDMIIADTDTFGISGIEFIKCVRRNEIQTSIILVSREKSFEYAQAAIEYSVQGYLLKPVQTELLGRIMQKVTDKIKHDLEEGTLRKQVNAYNRYQTIKYIIQKKIINPEDIRQFLIEECGFNKIKKFLGFVIRDDKELYRLDTADDIRHAAYRNFKEYFADYEYAVFLMGGDEVFVLFNETDSTLRMFCLTLQIRRMMDALNRDTINGSVSAGVSEMGSLTEIPLIYETAQRALDFRYCYGNGSCLEYRSCTEIEKQKREIPASTWNIKILNMVETYNESGLLETAAECRKELFGNKKERIQAFILENMLQVNEKNYLGRTQNEIQDSILEVRFFDELMVIWTEFLCRTVRESKEKHKYSYEVGRALEYTKSHYMEKVKVDDLAAYLSISEGHFSRIFKQQMGYSFTKYLNQYRMDRAEEMLMNTNMKVYEIAERVGISDYGYFVQVFRKFKGKTPLEIRNE